MAKVIIADGYTYVSEGGDIVTTLGGLSDVTITAASNGEILVYNSGTGKWENQASSELTTLGGLSDVTITSPANGELIVYNSVSGEWENSSIASAITSIDDLGDVTVTSAANGDVLVWNSTSSQWENESGYATETYVDSAIADLVDTAPATLDTLNELAAALGDDPNFATTVTNSLALKLEDITGESIWDLSDVTTAGRVTGGVLVWNGTNVVAENDITHNGNYATIQNTTNGQTILAQPQTALGAGYYPGLHLKSNQPNSGTGDLTGIIKSYTGSAGYGYSNIYFGSTASGDSSIRLAISDTTTEEDGFVIDKTGVYTPQKYMGIYHATSGGGNNEIYIQDPSIHGNVTVGIFGVYGKNASGTNKRWSKIETVVTDDTAGSEDSRVNFYVTDTGTEEMTFTLTRNSASVQNAPFLGLYNSGTTNEIFIQNSNSTPSNGDAIGAFTFYGADSATNDTKYAAIETEMTDTTDGSEYGRLYFNTIDGTLSNRMFIDGDKLQMEVPVKLKAYTSGSLPTGDAGMIVSVSDENYAPYYYDGTQWLNLYDIDGGSY